MKIFDDERKFMIAGDQTVDELNLQQKRMYESFIEEEFIEFQNAVKDEPLANQVKEANDILVVTCNWLLSVGVNPEKCWNAVVANNMLKVANPPIKDPVTGKIQKSPESIQGKKLMMAIIEKECE